MYELVLFGICVWFLAKCYGALAYELFTNIHTCYIKRVRKALQTIIDDSSLSSIQLHG